MSDLNSLILDFDHRLALLFNDSKEIATQEFENSTKVTVFNNSFHQDILNLKKEMSSLIEEADRLTKLVFELGSSLRDKVKKSDLDSLKKKIDSWNLEEFMTYKELVRNFEFYSQPEEDVSE